MLHGEFPEGDKALRSRISSLRNWSSNLSSTPSVAAQHESSMTDTMVSSAKEDSTLSLSEHCTSQGRLSDDDRFQQHFTMQLELYKKELAGLKERAQGVIAENVSLRKQVGLGTMTADHVSSAHPVACSTGNTAVVSIADDIRKLEDTPSAQLPEGTQQPSTTDALEGISPATGKHSMPSISDTADMLKSTVGNADPGTENSKISEGDVPVESAHDETFWGGQKFARVEVELVRCRRENDRLKKALEDVNIQDDLHKEQMAEVKGKTPSLCVECGSRQALVPQPISSEHQHKISELTRERDEALSWVKRAEDQLLHHRQKEKADQLQVQSLVESSQAANDRRHKVEVDLMNVQQTLKDKDHKYATQLEALQKEFSTSSDKRRKEWEKERTKLSAEVHELKVAASRMHDEKEELSSSLKHLEMQSTSDRRLHASEQESLNKYTKQQEKDINGLKQKLAEVQTEHKHVINQLQMCEERHKKESSDLKQQLAVSVSDNHNLQSLAKMTQQRVTELEVELLTGKENVLVSDAALHEALRQKDIEIQRLLVVSQSQVKEATFQYDQLQKQLASMEEELRRQITQWEAECRQWQSRFYELRTTSQTDIATLRRNVTSSERSAQSLRQEKDSLEHSSSLLKQDMRKQRKLYRKLERDLKEADGERVHWQSQVHVLLQKQRGLLLERRDLSMKVEQLLRLGNTDGRMSPSFPSNQVMLPRAPTATDDMADVDDEVAATEGG